MEPALTKLFNFEAADIFRIIELFFIVPRKEKAAIIPLR